MSGALTVEEKQKRYEEFLQWSSTQGYILTGAGQLNSTFVHFNKNQLPHYLLSEKISWKVFDDWLKANNRSFDIVGVWSRPIFCGGWKESGCTDTVAFNIQSPSLFIDMRFPVVRDNLLDKGKGLPQSLQDCSDEELIILSRQHCFSGYSFPEMFGRAKELAKHNDLQSQCRDVMNEHNYYKYGPVFTRHHIIDWNFHPSFPRPRPNQWWVEVSEDKQSFKEHCVARNPTTNLPVYFERWQRYPGDSAQSKYLVLRKILPCQKHLASSGARESVLIIVGNWFGYVSNRISTPFPSFPGAKGPGGPALIDYAIHQSQLAARNGDMNGRKQWRATAEAYLDITGCFGEVSSSKGDFVITKCTHPWLEGKRLISGDEVCISVGSNPSYSHLLTPITQFSWKNVDWKVLECTFGELELKEMFGFSCLVRDNQKSRL